jgi:hypothetical protein
MLNIKLEGLIDEPYTSKRTNDGKGWAVWRAIRLSDQDQRRGIAEWFYLMACNKTYFDEVSETEEWMKDSRAILIQDTYDEDRLLNFANEKIKHLQFVNWDDFYEKMSREFVYEDAEEESPR